ncbi:aldose 1-epimerase family protein [Flavobacterium humi]|uniref:Aldose 1-epimerase family protein n=1 Tax=Flavobacterium humi TaxID=2562683 RepID=A0A4Z0LAB3_9FLAO|nr:aldose 1-epimerase family protein [Flavobacterium humi]TGD58219.1 aldose 1-epimerase family protein [Flavobacterium humi]
MKIEIQNQGFSAEINSLGAELTRLDQNNFNYIWTVDKAFWDKTSPVLFPVVGKLKNDSYTIDDGLFSLSRHGFARDFDFEVHQKTENSVTFSLRENPQTLLHYPFAFELQIGYTLLQNTLVIEYFITNNAAGKMPFSIGAHPAFTIDGAFEDYALVFENDQELLRHELENGLFSGKTSAILLQDKTLPLHYSLFEKDALVFKKLKSKYLTILKNNNPFLKVTFGNFPSLGIWTKPDAPFLCIEPWQGYADAADANGAIFEKEGILVLDQGQTYKASFAIEML